MGLDARSAAIAARLAYKHTVVAARLALKSGLWTTYACMHARLALIHIQASDYIAGRLAY